MIDQIFKCKEAIRCHLKAHFLEERIKYLQDLADNGAALNTLQNIARLLLVAVNSLGFYQPRIVTLKEIENAANNLRKPLYYSRRQFNWSQAKRKYLVRHASKWLKMLGYLKESNEEVTPFTKYLFQYIEYMRKERCFSEATIKHRLFLLKDFCINIEEECKSLKRLTPVMVDHILIKKHNINGWSRRTIQSYASIVRVFIRYVEGGNWCKGGLAESIKVARVYKHETLPFAPSWDNVKKLLDTTKDKNPTNIRDRAILMLLIVYGLRSSEVAQLRLSDVDWKNEILYIHRAKNSKPQQFPLSKIVGEAILHYLIKVRQKKCSCREVFLCNNAPYRPLNSPALHRMVSQRWKLLNISIKHYGPHSLRHACASHLINEGISLKEISTHLGHQWLTTTQIYTKVDLTNLRKIADFNIGDLL